MHNEELTKYFYDTKNQVKDENAQYIALPKVHYSLLLPYFKKFTDKLQKNSSVDWYVCKISSDCPCRLKVTKRVTQSQAKDQTIESYKIKDRHFHDMVDFGSNVKLDSVESAYWRKTISECLLNGMDVTMTSNEKY